MKKLFLIIGAPGSGKTTDAKIIASKYNDIAHFSTGDLLRDEAASGSKLGEDIKSFISNGNLCPLDIVINTIVTAIKACKKNNIIIDGLPRSKEQLNALSKFLDKEENIVLTSVFEVAVTREIAKKRVLGRARGNDDKVEIFNNRMEVYTKSLSYIKNSYKKMGILKIIDASGTVESIVANIEQFILPEI